MSDCVYPESQPMTGFFVVLLIFCVSLTCALWLDGLYDIKGIVWTLPIVFTGSIVAMFVSDRRARILEVERALFFKKNGLTDGAGK